MQRISILMICVAVVAASCLKNDSNNGACPYQLATINISQSERSAIDDYIDSNNIQATQDRTGYYYQIINPGTGSDSVTLCSQIQISYKGQLVNDSTFDQQNNVVYALGTLIEGWKRSIPKLKRGGEIKLYLPPTLAYGNRDITDATGKVIIPKNSILKFDIKLTDYSAGN